MWRREFLNRERPPPLERVHNTQSAFAWAPGSCRDAMTVFDDSRRVLGIDLACRSWRDIGSALVAFKNKCFSDAVPRVMEWPSEDLTPAAVARCIDVFARDRDVAVVSIDGPQAWRDPTRSANCPGVGRACEYETRAPGKTGTYGVAYPLTFLRWIRFSISVFAELLSRPDVVLVNDDAGDIAPRPAGYWLIECFPTSTWRTSGLVALPGHRRAPAEVVERFARDLVAAYGLPPSAVTADHDDLQAVVSALPAVGLLGGPARAYARGEPARSVDSVPVEGIIWDAAPAGGAKAAATARPVVSTLLVDERDVELEPCIDRGAELFRELVRRATRGDAVGISYKGFVERVHGASFEEVRGRPWSQSDVLDVLHLAEQITGAVGRQSVRRGNVVIQAGMDTFIWRKAPPHTRSECAWKGDLPYSHADWLSVFPDGMRHLIDTDSGNPRESR